MLKKPVYFDTNNLWLALRRAILSHTEFGEQLEVGTGRGTSIKPLRKRPG